MPRLLPVLALCLPALAHAQDPPVGGIGLLACREVIGPENAPYLAQVGDWALGYMAGRLDAGQSPAGAAAPSPGRATDVVTGVALRCRQDPDMPVIEAVRSLADRIYGEAARAGAVDPAGAGPEPDEPEASDPAASVPRPEPRPDRPG